MTHTIAERNDIVHEEVPIPVPPPGPDNLGNDPWERLKNLLFNITGNLLQRSSFAFAIIALLFLVVILMLSLISDIVFRP